MSDLKLDGVTVDTSLTCAWFSGREHSCYNKVELLYNRLNSDTEAKEWDDAVSFKEIRRGFERGSHPLSLNVLFFSFLRF